MEASSKYQKANMIIFSGNGHLVVKLMQGKFLAQSY